MKQKIRKIIFGICLILLGLFWILETLDVVTIRLFDGWWTLFLIVPSVINLFTETNKSGPLVGLSLGTILLLAAQEVITYGQAWKLMIPMLIVIIGISLLFSIRHQKESKNVKTVPKEGKGDCKSYSAVFSGENLSFEGQTVENLKITSVFGSSDAKFHQALMASGSVIDLSAVFGGIDCDFKNAQWEDGVVINAATVFGGIDLYFPDCVNVQCTSTSILGGMDNKKRKNQEGNPTVYVNGTAVFGGIEIH